MQSVLLSGCLHNAFLLLPTAEGAEVRGAREKEEVALSALRPSVWVVLGVWHLRGESGRRRRHRELRGGARRNEVRTNALLGFLEE